MLTIDIFKARPFRLALGFCLAISVATIVAFGLIYLRVSSADVRRVGAVLVDEAAKSEGDSEQRLSEALALRLTRDVRRLDYVALFKPDGTMVFGNVPGIPAIPIDGHAYRISEQVLPNALGGEPALFVARRRPDRDVLVLGRSLREVYDVQETMLGALALALAPTILVILTIGAAFARRASRRLEVVHSAILRIMKGDLGSRLPVSGEGDDVDSIARAVNLMMNEIGRLLNQLMSVGDNIAHDLRTPLMVARARMERALEEEETADALRQTVRASLLELDRASVTISAILRISAIESGAREKRFTDLDVVRICAQAFDFFEPLAEAKSVMMRLEADAPVPMHGDEDLMREAIANLVDNAVKYTPPGGNIRIEALLVGGLPQVTVSDDGHGVPPHERAKIFNRFYMGAEGALGGGHGLGLNIAATIAHMHGLELAIEDNNPGARFVLRTGAKAPIGLQHRAG
jgi:signal transduction histidine kinase